MKKTLLSFVILGSLIWTTLTEAQDAARYLVLPLMGDQITIVSAAKGVGSSLDRNRYEIMSLGSNAFDATVLQSADTAIRKRQPQATVVMLRATDPKLDPVRVNLAEGDAVEIGPVLESLKSQTQDRATIRLVLISPRRAAVSMSTSIGHIGIGKVAGLGFYVDRFSTIYRSDTGERGKGFLGLFANFRMLLVDPSNGALLAQRTGTVGHVYSAARAEDTDPWNALSTEEKISELRSLLGTEIERLMPELLSEHTP